MSKAPSAVPSPEVLYCFAVLFAISVPSAAYADLEEVRILRAEPMQVQVCPAAGQTPAPQPSSGISGREVLGGVAGAAVGGLLGHQVGQGTGNTAATIAGAGVGGVAGYKLAEQKPPQQQASACTQATQYRVLYSRTNGMQGEITMQSPPASQSLMINFCGDQPCK